MNTCDASTDIILGEGPIQQALDLVQAEAAEILRIERGPRAFTRAERLIAIARALQRELSNGVIELDGTIPGGCNVAQFGGAGGPNQWPWREPDQDMRREHEMAQLESIEARRRKDEAEANVALATELAVLSKIDLSSGDPGSRERLDRRCHEILGIIGANGDATPVPMDPVV